MTVYIVISFVCALSNLILSSVLDLVVNNVYINGIDNMSFCPIVYCIRIIF